MKYKYLIIALILFASCSSGGKKKHPHHTNTPGPVISGKDHQNDKVLAYLKRRDDYIKRFKKLQYTDSDDSLYKSDSLALIDLQKRLRKILKNSQYSSKGEINLQTLIVEMGFGMLDGLTFKKDSMFICYTTKQLLFDYFKNIKVGPLNDLDPKNLEAIFNGAYGDDVGITNFSYIKIPSEKDIQAYGMVAVVGQDIGPFLPNYLYVLVSKGNYIYMAEKPLKQSIKQLPKCISIWDSIGSGSQKSDENYRKSDLQDTVAASRSDHLENVAWTKYCDCFQKEFKKDSQFKEIRSQLIKMSNFLEQ